MGASPLLFSVKLARTAKGKKAPEHSRLFLFALRYRQSKKKKPY
jgi:hypothetical protein